VVSQALVGADQQARSLFILEPGFHRSTTVFSKFRKADQLRLVIQFTAMLEARPSTHKIDAMSGRGFLALLVWLMR